MSGESPIGAEPESPIGTARHAERPQTPNASWTAGVRVQRREPMSATRSAVTRQHPPPGLSTAGFAARLGISAVTVRRWIRDGRVHAHVVGPRRIRIPAEELARVQRPTFAGEEAP